MPPLLTRKANLSMRREPPVLLTVIDQGGAGIQLFTDGMDGTAYAVSSLQLSAWGYLTQ